MSSTLYLLLLFVVYITHHGATTEAAIEPVKELNGTPLRSGINYYILPVIRGRGGGLTIEKPCPNSVIQEHSELSRGLSVNFSPVNKSRTIPVSTDLNIQFSAFSVWRLDNDETTNQSIISTCGVAGNPGRATVSNWFKIDKYESDYKIRFCPSVCDICRVICRDVGVVVQDGKRRLVLSDVPLKVMFIKA